MNIAIEARALSARGGVSRYVHNLVRALQELGSSHEFTILRKGPSHELLLPVWLHWSLPRRLARLSPDVVHFTKADVSRRKIAPTIVTIHDVIPLFFPESQKPLQRLYWPSALRRAAHESDHILTISQASKRDIVELCDVPPNKITVTPLATDPEKFRPASDHQRQALRARYKLNKPYVLFVGTIEPRKNVSALITAFARVAPHVPHDLVIAGQIYRGGDAIQRAIETSGISDRIRILDFIVPEDLAALYSEADLFVWPSIYEGWGFPPLEAMACGTPVIVSDGGSLPEVVGNAAVVVPFSEGSILARLQDEVFERRLSEAIGAVLTNEKRRRILGVSGQQQSRRYTWRQVAEATLAVYERVGHR